MKIENILKLANHLYELLEEYQFNYGSIKYFGAYEEFKQRKDDEKITYLMIDIASRYGVSSRQLARVIKEFQRLENVKNYDLMIKFVECNED